MVLDYNEREPRHSNTVSQKSNIGHHPLHDEKYITKPEAALHSKLTVAAAVRKTMSIPTEPGSSADSAKKMLLKVNNKLDSLREVGVPEAISHLLKFPDHYTDALLSIFTPPTC